MTLRDPFARTSRGATRCVRWFEVRHWLGLPYPNVPSLARPRRGFRTRTGYRRKLAAIERALVADTPALSSKFFVFNQLTADEQPVGAEQVPVPWSRPRPAYLAVLLALAAIAAICFTLSTQLHAAARPCQLTTAGAAAHAPVRSGSCHAYATNK
jgi:hypothetical protein